MQILCPQCHAVYEVGPLIKNAVLVCHRCQTEFDAKGQPVASGTNHTPANGSDLPLFEQTASGQKQPSSTSSPQPPAGKKNKSKTDEAPTKNSKNGTEKLDTQAPADESDNQKKAGIVPKHEVLSIAKIIEEGNSEVPEAPAAFQRKKSRIWPWLAMMLLLLGSGGFYFKQDAWLSHPWVRSLLINAHISLPLRNEDWSIVSDSVKTQWIERQDGSRILLIEGKVENRLYCSMNLPKILIRFFTPGSNAVVAEQAHIITEPPTIRQIRQAPYISPKKDKIPVESRGSRTFMIVIEESPKGGAHFELSPIATPQ